ncbi:YojF family protein [Paraliobacillus sp. JSM ZJ581]|uniref:YojF family protein n=1 Tax=Paraliobacillus sp. JSM ZJ581 TaxID=3342118 RepID=UPI0035A85CBB
MKAIDILTVQSKLEQLANQDVYVHIETTNGAYASHHNADAYNVGIFMRNANIRYHQAKIIGDDTGYRVGLKTEKGWIYAEGVREYEIDTVDRLLLAGHDREGRLMVALQISKTPFKE